MNIQGKRILVLGGYGLVGLTVCRELLTRNPGQLTIHSLHRHEAVSAKERLSAEAGTTQLDVAFGDIFGQTDVSSKLEQLQGQLAALRDEALPSFRLYQLLQESRPDVVIDCVNTATGIAYRNIFSTAEKMLMQLAKQGQDEHQIREAAELLLDSLYIPRLIRHIQILYRGMIDVSTQTYIKVGTTGTGGMGLNIPYTHSEEKPSRVLLSKSALAGAHSMLLFLMARTPGAPITKELKPAAAIAWKQIDYGPIVRKGEPIQLVDAKPRPMGATFSTHQPDAATVRPEVLHNVFIDTGENGIFSLEEFSALTTSEQMEFITPEEIARYLVFEIEGGNTGHDVINALDNASLGPSYRAGLMRHWALERMIELEQKHGVHSVAFEMLGPPRLSKLLFEAHLLRLTYRTMTALQTVTAEEVMRTLHTYVQEHREEANRIVSVGIPILLDSGELIRGPKVIIPVEATQIPVTPQRIDAWAEDGWVDLRLANCKRWVERFQRIHRELMSVPASDTSSRYLRNQRFWHHEHDILPGKIAGWIFSEEDQGARMK